MLFNGRDYGHVFALNRVAGRLYASTVSGVYRLPVAPGGAPELVLPGDNWSLNPQGELAAHITATASESVVAVRWVSAGAEATISLPKRYQVVSIDVGWAPGGKAFALYVRDTTADNKMVAAVFRMGGDKWTMQVIEPPAENLSYALPGAPSWLDDQFAVLHTIKATVINDAMNAQPQSWLVQMR